MELLRDALFSRYTYQDGVLINKVSLGKAKKGTKAGCLDRDGYIQISVDKKIYRAHRLIWLMHYGKFPDAEIDHINGIKNDNRIENLREATSSQNKFNQGKRKTNTSGFKGVSFAKKIGKWVAFVGVKGKQKNLGYFDDVELADLVAQEARDKYHKQYACNA